MRLACLLLTCLVHAAVSIDFDEDSRLDKAMRHPRNLYNHEGGNNEFVVEEAKAELVIPNVREETDDTLKVNGPEDDNDVTSGGDVTTGLEIEEVIEKALREDKPVSEEHVNKEDTREELDMLLTPEQEALLHGNQLSSRQKRKAISRLASRWTDNQVWYRRTPGVFSDAEWKVVLDAMAEWEKMTCLTFHEDVSETQDNYIRVQTGVGCSAHVGMTRGEQSLTLGEGCVDLGVVIHELGHAVGFFHEQSRPDRDDFVQINWDNIEANQKHNFDKGKISTMDVPYDYYSAMHYGKYFMTKNHKKTMVTKDARYQDIIGNQKQLSFYDVMLANRMYKCDSHCDVTNPCPVGAYRGKDCKCYCHGPSSDEPVQECDGTGNFRLTPAPVTTTPRPTGCQDQMLKEDICPGMASKGYCQPGAIVTYTREGKAPLKLNMFDFCPKSCDVCSTTDCQDQTVDDDLCSRMELDSQPERCRPMMTMMYKGQPINVRSFCSKSCGVCDE